MGKYTNVNTRQLDSSLNTLERELRNKSQNLTTRCTNLQNSMSLDVYKNIKQAFDSVTKSPNKKGSITYLEKRVNNLRKVLKYIEDYQKKEKEYERCEAELRRSRTVNPQLQSKIRSLKTELNSLDSKINSALSIG